MWPMPGRQLLFKSIPRAVFIVGLASFFTDLSSEMIYPLLPVFLSVTLGAGPLILGVIEGIAEATASLLKVISGVLTDRSSKRKPLIVLGYSISGFARPLVGLATAWPFVLVIRFLDRVGKGIRTAPRDALIADVVDEHNRGHAYGVHRALDHAGAVMGPLVAGALLLIPGMKVQTVFLLAAVPAAITVLILVGGLTEKAAKAEAPKTQKIHLFRDWKNLGPNYRKFLFALFIFTLGNSTDAFLLIRMSQLGVSNQWVAILWSLHHVVKMVSTYYGGGLTDRIGRKPAIIGGWIFYGFVYLAFALIATKAGIIALFLIYGIYYGLTEPSEKAFVADLAPPSHRGTAFGWYHFATGMALLPASLIFGLIGQKFGIASAFISGAVLAVIGSGLLLTVKKSRI